MSNKLISDRELELARQDMRVMSCARASYEVHSEVFQACTGRKQLPWSQVIGDDTLLKPWLSATLATLKTWKLGNTGRLSRGACGTGRLRTVLKKTVERVVSEDSPSLRKS